MKKTTERFVFEANQIHKNKYVYDLVKYNGSFKKVKIVCRTHGVFEQSPSNHLRGSGCPHCAREKSKKKQLKTQTTFISEAKKKHGDKYDYGTTIYTGANEKISIICKSHGPFEIRASHHLRGIGCPKCYGTQKHTLETFKRKAKQTHDIEYGYNRVSFDNMKDSILITCPFHGTFSQVAGDHIRGSDCPKCSREKSILKKRHTKNHFVELANKKHGSTYDYSQVEYNGVFTPVKILCREHGVFIQKPAHHLNGSGCPTCARDSQKRIRSLDTTEFVSKAKEIHGDLYDYSHSAYTRSHKDVIIECRKHGIFRQKPHNHLSGRGCSECSRQKSGGEKEISSFIESTGFDLKTRNRKIIRPKEIDILIPDLNLAIEYCGIYWHGETKGKNRKYHLEKYLECEKHGIDLITIFENEWKMKREIVTSRLLQRLGKSPNKIYARTCSIREIGPLEANKFLNENHIQGKDRSSIRIGLLYGDTLVSVMTFSKPRFSKGYDYEIQRYCCLRNMSVVGGAGKLFSYFVRKYDPKSVVTYSDLRWGKGEFYSNFGFSLLHRSAPNYFYFERGSILLESRNKYQKHKLIKKGFDSNLSEWEIMRSLGYDRIWDCGNNVWVWNR